MHAENSSLQITSLNSAQALPSPGTEVPSTVYQPRVSSHQCPKYLAKVAKAIIRTLPRPPRPPSIALTCQPYSQHARAVTLPLCLGRTPERLVVIVGEGAGFVRV